MDPTTPPQNPTQSISPVPEQPSETPPAADKKKLKLFIILGVLALLLLAGCAFAFRSLNQTANWKTYENKRLGFSFQYPEERYKYMDIRSELDDRIFLYFSESEHKVTPRFEDKDFTMMILATRSARILSSYLEIKNSISGNIHEEIVVNGIQWQTYSRATYKFDYECITAQNDYMYVVKFTFLNESLFEKNKEPLTQILSTFQFTN